MGAVFEGIQHAAEHRVGKVNRSEVALDSLFPLTMIADVSEVTIGSAFLSCWRQIIEIVFAIAGRKLNRIERKGLEVFLRNKPGLVGAIDTTGEEEGLFLFAGQLITNPFRHQPVTAEFFVSCLERCPVGFNILPRTASR